MSKSQPQAPAAPDYAAANKAAVETDIATLPLRNAINSASALGTSYTDPNTGKVYDFTGLGQSDINSQLLMQQLQDAPAATQALLGLQQQFGTQFADEARKQLQATDPTGFSLRNSLGQMLGGSTPSLDVKKYLDARPDLSNNWNADPALANKYGTLEKYAQADYEQNKGGNEVYGKDWYDQYMTPGQAGPGSGLEAMYAGQPAAPIYEGIHGNGPTLDRLDLSKLPQFSRVNDLKLQGDTGQEANARNALEQQTFDEMAKTGSGQLDPLLTQAAQQASRARGAANGNLLGDSSALQESLAVQLANQARGDQNRAATQSLLASGQGVSDKANSISQAQLQADLASRGFNNAASQQEFGNTAAATGFNNDAATQSFNNVMAAINQRNQAAQNTFSGQQGLIQQKAGARQQDLANQQSFLGLQPIVSQGAQLSGLQSGAAPFAAGSGYQSLGTNQGAGAAGTAFAGNIFGTQAGIYGQQLQNSGSPLGSIAGGLAGGFLGPLGTAAGASAGKKLFG